MKMGFQAAIPTRDFSKKFGENFGEIEWSGQQVHPPQQVLEARVVAEGEIWIQENPL